MIKRFLAVLAATVAALGAGAGSALADYPPSMQTGAVSSTTIVVGHTVDFAGDGFADGSKVVVTVNKAVYATVVADGGSSSSSLGSRSSAHISTVAYARPAAFVAAAAAGTSFKVKVTLDTLGSKVLLGTGLAPDGTPRAVMAKVLVIPAVATKPTASGLPFTGSAVIIPGVIVGAVMLAGGFLMLTTVRSRKASTRA